MVITEGRIVSGIVDFFFSFFLLDEGMRAERTFFFLDICFCSSTQCHVWYVPPDGWNCCVISRPLWCWHRNLLPHGVSWDSHHSRQRGGKNALSFHQCHSPTTQDWVKIFASFFHNHPSRPYSQGVFPFHNTELLLYTLIQGKGCYFFLIAA